MTAGENKSVGSDELWVLVVPLLPAEPPKPQRGRRRVSDRAALTGIIFVLKSGILWEMRPREMGRGSGMTCWRHLRDWRAAWVWDALHRTILDRLGEVGEIACKRASLESTIPANRGAKPSARTRRIAANRARSAMLWSNGAGSRSRQSCLGPTGTTRWSAPN